MARPQGSKNKLKIAYRCEDCGETGFTSKKCPECDSTHVLQLNKNGIPVTDMQNAIGAQPDLPMIIGSAPDIMDPAAELRKVVDEDKIQTISELTLDKIKARAATEKMARIRAEEELALTEKGFRPPEETKQVDPMAPQQQQRTIGMDPSMLLRGIGQWDEDARKDLFDRLSNDDDFALNWSRAFNAMPQQQMPMNAQQMMNPWANPMMMGQPQQQPQAEPESASSMMTAMLAGLAQLQELTGGNGGNDNAALDRLMDRIERMEERSAERDNAMQQRIADMQQTQGNSQITPQDVQQMIHSTIANSSTDQLAASIESINGVVTGLQSLGVVHRIDERANDKEDFEQTKWNKEFELEKSEREHKRKREEETEARQAEIELAKQETTQGMLKMMVDVNKESVKEVEEVKDEAKPAITPARSVVS
jgi:hypothetical protein